MAERIDDMLGMIEAIRQITAMPDRLETKLVRKLAMERAFSILSEASRHTPDETKKVEPEVPWRDIAGIGYVLQHDYQAVSEDALQ